MPKNPNWIHQEPSEERMMLSQDLMMLSLVFEASSKRFDVALRDFQREFRKSLKRSGYRYSVPPQIRHVFDESNRHQFFVIFLDGSQFDYFEFGPSMVGGALFDE